MTANWISKFAHSTEAPFSLDMYFFPELGSILADDVIGHTLARRGV